MNTTTTLFPGASCARIFAGYGPRPLAEADGLARISAQFDVFAAETVKTNTAVSKVQADVTEIGAEVDKLARLVGALRVGGTGNDTIPGNRGAELKAMAIFARTGDNSGIAQIQASLSSDSGPDGGFTVMPAISSGWTKKLFDSVTMRKIARVETITVGDAWEEPLDFGDLTATWVTERQARPATATPQIGMLRVPVNELYALQPITQRLLSDSGFDLGTWLDNKIIDRFARSEDLATISGDGVKQPQGLLSAPNSTANDDTRPVGTVQYITTGASGAFGGSSADNLKDLMWKLRAPYRAGAGWLMNSNVAGAVDKLKDGVGNYIWRDSSLAGVPPVLWNYPVYIDENMPDMAAGSLSVAFGNFKLAYVLVDKAGVNFLRDPYSDKPNVQFYAYRRTGGGVANTEAVKFLKFS